MKPRKPAVVKNTSCSKTIEVEWNLPVRLDALTDYTVSGGNPEAVAEGIFDAATALACAKGTCMGRIRFSL